MHAMNLFGGGLMMVFWWALVIALVLLAFKWFQGQNAAPGDDSALEILKKRYAGGEISKTEYETMKKELN